MLCTIQCRPASACVRKSPSRVHSKETRQDKTSLQAAAAAASGPSSFHRNSRYWCHSSIWLFAPPPPMAGMRPTLSIDDRRSLLCENDFVLLLVPCHHLTQHPPSISPRAGRKRQWTAQAARGGEGRRQGRPRRGHDVARVDETDAGGAAALGGRPR